MESRAEAMPRCAFLTIDDLADHVTDDDLAVPPLRALGWEVEFVSWRTPSPGWSRFDLVVIRSTWDYHRDLASFLASLEIIAACTRLENALPLVRWNVRKTYLRELEQRGIPVVPTVWAEDGLRADLRDLARDLRADALIVKPVVSASAEDTYRVDPLTAAPHLAQVQARFAARACLIQPFQHDVLDRGEISLVYLAGRFSHAVRKLPAPGDFRVQEEHGGQISPAVSEPGMLEVGRRALSVLPGPTLYARVDLISDAAGLARVMELEVVEPSLYLRLDPQAPQRLAEAIAALA